MASVTRMPSTVVDVWLMLSTGILILRILLITAFNILKQKEGSVRCPAPIFSVALEEPMMES